MSVHAPARRNQRGGRTAQEPFVQLQDVTLTYGRRPRSVTALEKTNLKIEQGDFVALVGPSGCGKSTILKLVTGLISASSGCGLCRRPRNRRRAGARRHGVPEPDHAAVAQRARQRHAAAQDRPAVPAGVSRASANASSATAPKRCWRRSGSPASATNILGSSPAACCSGPRCAAR